MSDPGFDERFEVGADSVARPRAGVIAAGLVAAACSTIPVRYAACSRATWTGPWPLPRDLASWPDPEPDGTLRKWSVLFIGPVGVGKSHAATALFRDCVARSRDGGSWLDVSELLDSIRRAIDHGPRSAPEEASYSRGVLLLDDLGAERGTEWTRDCISRLLRYRHRHSLATIVTSNARSVAELSAALDARIVSRFAEGEIALLDGSDRRTQ